MNDHHRSRHAPSRALPQPGTRRKEPPTKSSGPTAPPPKLPRPPATPLRGRHERLAPDMMERPAPKPGHTPRQGGKASRRPEPTVAPSEICRIIYSDDALVVVDKRPGYPVVPSGPFQRRSALMALADLGFGHLYPTNLLDAEATGLVIFTRSKEAAQAMRWNWRSKLCEREYTVVVHGDIQGGRGRITLSIGAVRSSHGVRHEILPPEDGGRSAVTQWRLIARGRNMSRLHIKLKAGRTHQVRIHFAAIGHPVVGDRMHGFEMSDVPLTALVDMPQKYADAATLPPHQIALHCSRIAVPHPFTEAPMVFTAPLPRILVDLMPGAWIVDET
jgi:RluA family pseudouridine synthase